MSIQWLFIIGVLYFEVFAVLALVSPIFNFRRWNNLLQRPLMLCIREHSSICFFGLMGILIVFLVDSLRDVVKYYHSPDLNQIQLTSEIKNSINLFKSQRNFFIIVFSVIFTIIIKRVVTILIMHHGLQETFDTMIGKTQEVLRLTAEAATEDAEERLQQKMDEMEENLQESLRSLEEQKLKSIEMEKEAKMWRQKYEELRSSQNSQG